MLEKYKEKLERLKICVKMKTEEDVQNFDLLVGELVNIKTEEMLSELFDIFDDECEFHEVMYGLVHAVEIYPKDIYLKVLTKKISYAINKYPMWLEILFNRIFNSVEYTNSFKKLLYLVQNKSLNSLLDLIDLESPHHKEQIEELRKLIKIR